MTTTMQVHPQMTMTMVRVHPQMMTTTMMRARVHPQMTIPATMTTTTRVHRRKQRWPQVVTWQRSLGRMQSETGEVLPSTRNVERKRTQEVDVSAVLTHASRSYHVVVSDQAHTEATASTM